MVFCRNVCEKRQIWVSVRGAFTWQYMPRSNAKQVKTALSANTELQVFSNYVGSLSNGNHLHGELW